MYPKHVARKGLIALGICCESNLDLIGQEPWRRWLLQEVHWYVKVTLIEIRVSRSTVTYIIFDRSDLWQPC
jgi:hypothetical protein